MADKTPVELHNLGCQGRRVSGELDSAGRFAGAIGKFALEDMMVDS